MNQRKDYMELNNDITLIDGLPIAFIKSLNALVISDLHLGYESMNAKNGMLLPHVNLDNIKRELSSALKSTDAVTLIVTGDIKNEFSNVDIAEFNELYEFMKFAKEKHVEIVLIKGNHDNFIERYKEPFKLKIYEQEARIGNYLFFHGEQLPAENERNPELLVMGHEHPSITVYSKSGKQERLKCFLYGKYKKIPLLVMPTINYFMSGTSVNVEPKSNLLSPIFKYADIDRMRAIAVGFGSTMDFGAVKELRKAASL